MEQEDKRGPGRPAIPDTPRRMLQRELREMLEANKAVRKFLMDQVNAIRRELDSNPDLPAPRRMELVKFLAEVLTQLNSSANATAKHVVGKDDEDEEEGKTARPAAPEDVLKTLIRGGRR